MKSLFPLLSSNTNYLIALKEKSDGDLAEALKQIDAIKVTHSENHKLEVKLDSHLSQISDLQQSLSESHVNLLEERSRLLDVVAENDGLKSENEWRISVPSST